MNKDPLRAVEGELTRLLGDLFDAAELRRWLRMGIDGKDIEAQIPPSAGLADMVDKAVQGLWRYGLLNDEFFERLEKERPRRREEIQQVFAAFKAAKRASVFKTKDLDTGSLTTFGNADRFQLLFKVASPDFVRSTKAMQVTGGCVLQVSTRERAPGGGWAVAEAVTFVPDVRIVEEFDSAGNVVGRHLEPLTREAE